MKPHTEYYRGFKIVATPHSAFATRGTQGITAPNLHVVKEQIDRFWSIDTEPHAWEPEADQETGSAAPRPE